MAAAAGGDQPFDDEKREFIRNAFLPPAGEKEEARTKREQRNFAFLAQWLLINASTPHTPVSRGNPVDHPYSHEGLIQMLVADEASRDRLIYSLTRLDEDHNRRHELRMYESDQAGTLTGRFDRVVAKLHGTGLKFVDEREEDGWPQAAVDLQKGDLEKLTGSQLLNAVLWHFMVDAITRKRMSDEELRLWMILYNAHVYFGLVRKAAADPGKSNRYLVRLAKQLNDNVDILGSLFDHLVDRALHPLRVIKKDSNIRIQFIVRADGTKIFRRSEGDSGRLLAVDQIVPSVEMAPSKSASGTKKKPASRKNTVAASSAAAAEARAKKSREEHGIPSDDDEEGEEEDTYGGQGDSSEYVPEAAAAAAPVAGNSFNIGDVVSPSRLLASPQIPSFANPQGSQQQGLNLLDASELSQELQMLSTPQLVTPYGSQGNELQRQLALTQARTPLDPGRFGSGGSQRSIRSSQPSRVPSRSGSALLRGSQSPANPLAPSIQQLSQLPLPAGFNANRALDGGDVADIAAQDMDALRETTGLLGESSASPRVLPEVQLLRDAQIAFEAMQAAANVPVQLQPLSPGRSALAAELEHARWQLAQKTDEFNELKARLDEQWGTRSAAQLAQLQEQLDDTRLQLEKKQEAYDKLLADSTQEWDKRAQAQATLELELAAARAELAQLKGRVKDTVEDAMERSDAAAEQEYANAQRRIREQEERIRQLMTEVSRFTGEEERWIKQDTERAAVQRQLEAELADTKRMMARQAEWLKEPIQKSVDETTNYAMRAYAVALKRMQTFKERIHQLTEQIQLVKKVTRDRTRDSREAREALEAARRSRAEKREWEVQREELWATVKRQDSELHSLREQLANIRRLEEERKQGGQPSREAERLLDEVASGIARRPPPKITAPTAAEATVVEQPEVVAPAKRKAAAASPASKKKKAAPRKKKVDDTTLDEDGHWREYDAYLTDVKDYPNGYLHNQEVYDGVRSLDGLKNQHTHVVKWLAANLPVPGDRTLGGLREVLAILVVSPFDTDEFWVARWKKLHQILKGIPMRKPEYTDAQKPLGPFWENMWGIHAYLPLSYILLHCLQFVTPALARDSALTFNGLANQLQNAVMPYVERADDDDAFPLNVDKVGVQNTIDWKVYVRNATCRQYMMQAILALRSGASAAPAAAAAAPPREVKEHGQEARRKMATPASKQLLPVHRGPAGPILDVGFPISEKLTGQIKDVPVPSSVFDVEARWEMLRHQQILLNRFALSRRLHSKSTELEDTFLGEDEEPKYPTGHTVEDRDAHPRVDTRKQKGASINFESLLRVKESEYAPGTLGVFIRDNLNPDEIKFLTSAIAPRESNGGKDATIRFSTHVLHYTGVIMTKEMHEIMMREFSCPTAVNFNHVPMQEDDDDGMEGEFEEKKTSREKRKEAANGSVLNDHVIVGDPTCLAAMINSANADERGKRNLVNCRIVRKRGAAQPVATVQVYVELRPGRIGPGQELIMDYGREFWDNYEQLPESDWCCQRCQVTVDAELARHGRIAKAYVNFLTGERHAAKPSSFRMMTCTFPGGCEYHGKRHELCMQEGVRFDPDTWLCEPHEEAARAAAADDGVTDMELEGSPVRPPARRSPPRETPRSPVSRLRESTRESLGLIASMEEEEGEEAEEEDDEKESEVPLSLSPQLDGSTTETDEDPIEETTHQRKRQKREGVRARFRAWWNRR